MAAKKILIAVVAALVIASVYAQPDDLCDGAALTEAATGTAATGYTSCILGVTDEDEFCACKDKKAAYHNAIMDSAGDCEGDDTWGSTATTALSTLADLENTWTEMCGAASGVGISLAATMGAVVVAVAMARREL